MTNTRQGVTVFSYLLFLSGVLLLAWWILLGVSQAGGASDGSMAGMARAASWLPINIAGLAGSLFLVLGLVGILLRDQSQLGAAGITGTVLSITGTVLFTAVQVDETFVWPLLSRHAPQLLEIDGPMFTDPPFFSMYIIMGIVFILGFILLAIQAMRRRIYPLTACILLLAGAVLFGGGLLVPVIVRTVGVVILGVSLIWIGIRQIRT